ncbi:MAG: hypothetical protein ACJAZ2_001883 [Glaciecola sp.]|jgi:hypothetical protein
MTTPGEKLAESLEKLKELQDQGVVGIKASDLSRVHKERLVDNGFIKEVVKGWYISVSHEEKKGDSTSWFTSFWMFCARYLEDRYGDDYCVSAEQSLMLHSGNHSVPSQLIIRASKGNNLPTQLLHSTSLFVMKSPLPAVAEVEIIHGLRIISLESAIVHCSPSFFRKQATDVRSALMMIKDSSQLLGILLDGGHSKIAGRLVGAYRNLNRDNVADEILKTMKSGGYHVREIDPFTEFSLVQLEATESLPHVNRILLMWDEMRTEVLQVFPKVSKVSKEKEVWLQEIEEMYTTDAYHSLSIEKYRVTPELIERVRSGTWDVKENEEDKKHKDAMAARGYWQAFNAVKESIDKVLDGRNAGEVANEDHRDWYRELFAPSVTVGILKASDLAGYRNSQVYIGQSRHTPINKDHVLDVMPLLFKLLFEEKEASVRAVLGHFIFVYTHPYIDGNGRMGRFLMNVMLVSGGYPWTIVPVEERERYMSALESASVDQNIRPFAEFLSYLVEAGLKGEPIAKL